MAHLNGGYYKQTLSSVVGMRSVKLIGTSHVYYRLSLD